MKPTDTELQNTPEPAVTEAPPVDLTAGAVAALDEALAAETPKPAAEPEPAKPVEAAPPVDGAKPEEAAKPAEKTVDEEVAELGLKEKSAQRFRELSGYKAAVHEAGIEKLEDLPRIVERAKFADELETAIVETGASPEQYGMAIQYLALVNSRNPQDMEKAYEVMQAELAALSKALGKEAPGIHDPLAEHADLQAEVQAGDLSRKRALEIAQQRAVGTFTAATTAQQREEAEQKATFDRALSELSALGAQLKASDPQYAAKLQALQPTIALIRERCPPSEWAQRVQAAYQQVVIAAPAPAPVAPLPPPGPVRSVVPAGVQMQAEPKSAMEALDMALAAVGNHR